MSTQNMQGFWIILVAHNLEKTYSSIFSISLCTNLTKSENYAVLKTARKHTVFIEQRCADDNVIGTQRLIFDASLVAK